MPMFLHNYIQLRLENQYINIDKFFTHNNIVIKKWGHHFWVHWRLLKYVFWLIN